MSILVTGGAGYIGSHTVAELLEASEEVIVIDNLQKGHRKAQVGGKFYQGDLRDQEILDQVFRENDIEAVIHFAADSLVGESVTEPLKYYNNNLVSTLKLLTKMKEASVKRIVFSSSAATYGEPDSIPILESDATRPTNPYGETKLAIENALKWVDNAHGVRYISLRYFNAAGAHISGRIGEDHKPETHLIPLILRTALNRQQPVRIFGGDYDTPDGSCIRDYIHVSDLAQAHVLALNWLRRSGESRIFNLGNGKGFSVKEVLETARQVTGINIEAVISERRPGDPAVLIASSRKIMSDLGWRPRFADLKLIVDTAWKWHRSHPDGFGD